MVFNGDVLLGVDGLLEVQKGVHHRMGFESIRFLLRRTDELGDVILLFIGFLIRHRLLLEVFGEPVVMVGGVDVVIDVLRGIALFLSGHGTADRDHRLRVFGHWIHLLEVLSLRVLEFLRR